MTRLHPEGNATGKRGAREPHRSVLLFRECATLLQTLSFYGAMAIASFGWALGRLLGFPTGSYLPLWCAASLFVYNVDRLKSDPADSVNIPRRHRESLRLRGFAAAVAIASGVALLLIPLLERDWMTLALAAGGGAVCFNYSVPLFGFRLKDIPLIKTFFAPTLVCAAYFALPMIHGLLRANSAFLLFLIVWTWFFLLFNMVLCDLRDIKGDKQTRTLSVPVVLGANRTSTLLTSILIILALLGIAIWHEAPADRKAFCVALCSVSPVYLGFLAAAVRPTSAEAFYEWWVEGMIFIPALLTLASGR